MTDEQKTRAKLTKSQENRWKRMCSAIVASAVSSRPNVRRISVALIEANDFRYKRKVHDGIQDELIGLFTKKGFDKNKIIRDLIGHSDHFVRMYAFWLKDHLDHEQPKQE